MGESLLSDKARKELKREYKAMVLWQARSSKKNFLVEGETIDKKSLEKARRDFHKEYPDWKKKTREAYARAAKLTREIEEAHRRTAKSTLNFGPGPKKHRRKSRK